jgi:hypothetical protein
LTATVSKTTGKDVGTHMSPPVVTTHLVSA